MMMRSPAAAVPPGSVSSIELSVPVVVADVGSSDDAVDDTTQSRRPEKASVADCANTTTASPAFSAPTSSTSSVSVPAASKDWFWNCFRTVPTMSLPVGADHTAALMPLFDAAAVGLLGVALTTLGMVSV